MKTIAQISTPLGSGGVSVIRMSGKNSLNIARQIFCSKNLKDDVVPRHMYYGTINYNGFTERCLMVYFKAPFSYTGEDVIEFQCHGGELLTTQILNACLQNGAVLAENGEFTKLAFVNGKISLDEAESVIDMINATSDAELKATNQIVRGELFKTISSLQQKIKDALVNLEVAIDYPEHDDEALGVEHLTKTLLNVKQVLSSLKDTAKNGLIIKSGINVAIVGKPNVGKSSLLNALLGEDRAIVTSVKGTTRDTLKETINYKGIKINFIDTAGIHDSEDEVEKIGINRSVKSLNDAHLVLALFDLSENFEQEDYNILDLCKQKKAIIVLNKSDIKNDNNIKSIIIKKLYKDCKIIEVSAKNNINIDLIKQEILNCTISQKIDFSSIIITNTRHLEAINLALSQIENVLKECKYQTLDILDMLTKEIWQTLGRITGQTENEDIISGIFKKFCLGK